MSRDVCWNFDGFAYHKNLGFFFFQNGSHDLRQHCGYFNVISIYSRYCLIFFDFSLN